MSQGTGMGANSLALFYVLPYEVNFCFVLFCFVFNVIDEGFSPTPQTSLPLSLFLSLSLSLLNFFRCVLIVFFNNLSFSLGRRSVPFTCLLGNESITVTNGLIYNYSKQSQKFSLREFSSSIKNSVSFSKYA